MASGAGFDEAMKKLDDQIAARKALVARLGGDGTGPLGVVEGADRALFQADLYDAPKPSTEDLAAALGYLPAAHRHLDCIETKLIDALLDAGFSWEQVAQATGRRSKQAAQQRYRRIGGRRG